MTSSQETSTSMEELAHTLLKGILSARELPTAATVVWSFAFLRHCRSNMTRSLMSVCCWLGTDIRIMTINTQLSGQAHKTGRMLTAETFTKRDPHSFRHPVSYSLHCETRATGAKVGMLRWRRFWKINVCVFFNNNIKKELKTTKYVKLRA